MTAVERYESTGGRPPPADPPIDMTLIVDDPETWIDREPSEIDRARQWHPETLGHAEWAMRMCSDATRLIDIVSQLYVEEMSRLDDWQRDATKQAHRAIGFFEPLLEQYAYARRDETKTTKLPSGEVTTRSVPAKIEITDEKRLMEFLDAWLDENASLWAEIVHVSYRVRVSELAKYVKSVKHDDGTWSVVTPAGEPVPGVLYIPESVSVRVKPRP